MVKQIEEGNNKIPAADKTEGESASMKLSRRNDSSSSISSSSSSFASPKSSKLIDQNYTVNSTSTDDNRSSWSFPELQLPRPGSPDNFNGTTHGHYTEAVPTAATESPSTQAMMRGPADQSSSCRIPASVFATNNPAAPLTWSVASNESLFSITMGNIGSFRGSPFLLDNRPATDENIQRNKGSFNECNYVVEASSSSSFGHHDRLQSINVHDDPNPEVQKLKDQSDSGEPSSPIAYLATHHHTGADAGTRAVVGTPSPESKPYGGGDNNLVATGGGESAGATSLLGRTHDEGSSINIDALNSQSYPVTAATSTIGGDPGDDEAAADKLSCACACDRISGINGALDHDIIRRSDGSARSFIFNGSTRKSAGSSSVVHKNCRSFKDNADNTNPTRTPNTSPPAAGKFLFCLPRCSTRCFCI